LKYVKRFSLLPQKQGFDINSIHITNALAQKLYTSKKFKNNLTKKENVENSQYLEKSFKLEVKSIKKFRDGFKFSSVYTDGYSVSIVFSKEVKVKISQKSKLNQIKINEMKQETLNNGKPLAGFDPGVTNLFTLHSIVEKKSIKNKQYVKHFKKKKKTRRKS